MVNTLRRIEEALDATDERRRKRGHDGLTEQELRAIAASEEARLERALKGPEISSFTRRKRGEP